MTTEAAVEVQPKRIQKKRPAKKTAPPKKIAVKKVTSKTVRVSKPRTGYDWRVLDDNGFTPGSESAKIAAILVKGGMSRTQINDAVRKAIPAKTRNGTPKNVPALVSGIAHRMIHEKGFKVESTWRLVPPAKRGRKKTA